MSPGLESAARCAVHLDTAAVVACSRCGSYLCEPCTAVKNPPLCRPCGARTAAKAPPFSFRGSFRQGGEYFERTFKGLFAVAGLFALPPVILAASWPHVSLPSFLGPHLLPHLAPLVLSFTVGMIGLGAAIALLTSAADRRATTVGPALRQSMQIWPRLAWANLRSYVLALLFALALVVPGVIKLLDYSLVDFAVWDGAADPLKRSTALVRGHRWAMFGIVLVYLCVSWVLGGVLQFMLGAAAEWEELRLFLILVREWAALVISYYVMAVWLAAYRSLQQAEQTRLAAGTGGTPDAGAAPPAPTAAQVSPPA